MSERDKIKTLLVKKPLKLDCGQTISDFPLAYERCGKLKDKKDNFYLVSFIEDIVADLKKAAIQLGSKKLSFAREEYLMQYLGIKPGSVSPFGLINDYEKKVKFFFDSEFMNFDIVNFHPLVNTATVSIAPSDLINLIEEHHSKVEFINMRQFQK